MRFWRLLFLAALACPLPARAEMASLFGIGPVSEAMGGVSAVQGEYSPFQVYSAPAALGFMRRVEIDYTAQYFDPQIRPFGTVVLDSNGTQGQFPSAGVLPGGGSLLGFALPIGKDHPLTIGGAIFMPFSTLLRVSGTPVNYPFYPLYTDISRNFFFVLGAGYELFKGFALGLNMRSTTSSTTTYQLRSDSNINYSASATEAKSQSHLSFSALYDHGRVNPDSPYTVGAMYRAKSELQTEISADITAFVPVQGELTSLPSYTPAEWVLMGSWKPRPSLTLSGDFSWVKWSDYSSPYGSGNINSYVFGSGSQANFHDIAVFRLGGSELLPFSGSIVKQWTLREGYQYHPSPVPDQTGDANFVDNNRHLFSLGLGLGFKNPWHDDDLINFDTFMQYNLLATRDVHKNSPTNVGAPGYSTGGYILLFGGGASLRF